MAKRLAIAIAMVVLTGWLIGYIGRVVSERRTHSDYRVLGPFAGWTVLDKFVTVTGVVSGGKLYENDTIFTPDEHDWNLYLRPDDPKWATHDGHVNKEPAAGFVELEAQPVEPFKTEPEFNKYFALINNRRVIVCGTWVNDDAHGSKTEIHPVAALLVPYDHGVRVIAMMEDSGNRSYPPARILVPFTKWPWTLRFQVEHATYTTFRQADTVQTHGAIAKCNDENIGPDRKLLSCEVDTGYGFFSADFKFATLEPILPPDCPNFCLGRPCRPPLCSACCAPLPPTRMSDPTLRCVAR